MIGSNTSGWAVALLISTALVACSSDGGRDSAAHTDSLDADAASDTGVDVDTAVVADSAVDVAADTVTDSQAPSDDADVAATDDTADALDTHVQEDTLDDMNMGHDDTVAGCRTCEDAHRPVVVVHGINGSSAEFATMLARLEAAGWPSDRLYPFDAADPAWGCNVDNADAIAALVEQALSEHPCAARVDLVAHSMGTLSSRYYVKNLGGTEKVNTYVTLGGMHHGLTSPCWAPDFLGVCVWSELCETGDYLAQLNEAPATPGDLYWVSIYGTADATVPEASSILDGAENIAIEGAEHAGENGLLEREDAWLEVLRVLRYGCHP